MAASAPRHTRETRIGVWLGILFIGLLLAGTLAAFALAAGGAL